MPLPLRHRTVHYYKLRLRSSTKSGIRNPAMAPIGNLLTACFAKLPRSGLPFEISSQTKAQVMLDDWRHDAKSGYYELLFSKADADQSDISLRKLRSTNRRNAQKQPDEGFEDSAHALLRPNLDGSTATVLLTMGTGIGAKDVARLLKTLAGFAASDAKSNRKSHSLFFFDDPSGAKGEDGNPIKYSVRYNFEYESYMGETLTTALADGEFRSMELIGAKHQAFDANNGNLQISGHTMQVKPVSAKLVTPASLINSIRNHLKLNPNQQFQSVKFHYESANGGTRDATLSINDLDAAFTKKDRIEFDTDVESYQSRLHPTILGHLHQLMQALP